MSTTGHYLLLTTFSLHYLSLTKPPICFLVSGSWWRIQTREQPRLMSYKFYFAFTWDKIVNLHKCICKNKICIRSDPGIDSPICKYTPVCICVRMHHLLTSSKICTPEYIYTRVFLTHANWT